MKPRVEPPGRQVALHYRTLVASKHPQRLHSWPILSGHDSTAATFHGWLVVILRHTGKSGMTLANGIGELPDAAVGVPSIDASNIDTARAHLEKHFRLKAEDGVVIIPPGATSIEGELRLLLQRHESAMGLSPMKIFLSHKGADKALVREYRSTLALLGFDPWLDEDAMSAGAELERGILKGFSDSCAAVFFVTPNFKDEHYLATEVDYAISEKRKKNDKFAIITLVFQDIGKKGDVPPLLQKYVWKEPQNALEALREIVRALPIQPGTVHWRP